MTKPKILVVGDVMLDRYIHGVVERISPEAPIPILRQTHVEERPGGAANVAMNLASLGAEVELVGAIGLDVEGEILKARVRKAGVVPSLLWTSTQSSNTALKVRMVSMGQQMLRVDQDGTRPDEKELEQIAVAMDRELPTCRALVLSDYAGGVLDQVQDLITAAVSRRIPVYVDPKGTDWSRYRGATLIKPNEAELRAVVGDCERSEMLCRGAKLLRELSVAEMLVTHGAGGMTWINCIDDFKYQPAASGPVVDVTGAGDTVLAVVAYLHCTGDDWRHILPTAARGAAAVCARHGTSVVKLGDLGNESVVRHIYKDIAAADLGSMPMLQAQPS